MREKIEQLLEDILHAHTTGNRQKIVADIKAILAGVTLLEVEEAATAIFSYIHAHPFGGTANVVLPAPDNPFEPPVTDPQATAPQVHESEDVLVEQTPDGGQAATVFAPAAEAGAGETNDDIAKALDDEERMSGEGGQQSAE